MFSGRSGTGVCGLEKLWRDVAQIIDIYLYMKIYNGPLSQSEGIVLLSPDPPPSSLIPTLVAAVWSPVIPSKKSNQPASTSCESER